MATERSVLVRIKANTSGFVKDVALATAAVNTLRKEIDTTNDRTAWLAQSILALGPAIAPLGAAAVPILSGLATQMMLTAGAAGTAALAFSGVGDALGAVNDYQLEPTAANLEKMNQALAKIGPDGAEFVAFLDAIGPKFADLQMAAREGMFPGIEEGLTSFLDLLPRLRTIVTGTAEAMGELAASAGAGLAGEGFADFFDYLERNAKPLLIEMGQTIGNFAEGIGAMMVAFEPLTDQFSSGFENMSASFATWAHGLDESSSFAAFVDYVQQSIPKSLDLLSSLSDAFVSLLQAAAPVGDKMLPVLELFFDTMSLFLDSPFGPVFLTLAAAMSVYGRAAALAQITTSGLGKTLAGSIINVGALKAALTTARPPIDAFANSLYRAGQATQNQSLYTRATNQMVGNFARTLGPAAAAAGLFAVAMSDVDDKAGLTNTTMGAMLGMIAGPWGVAVGSGIGLFLDFKNAGDAFAGSLRGVDTALDNGVGGFEQARAQIAGLRDETAALIEEYNNPALTTGFSVGYWKEVAQHFGNFADMYQDEVDAINARNDELVEAEDALVNLGRAFSFDFEKNDDGTLVRGLDELGQVSERAAPAMRALGITLADLAGMEWADQQGAIAAIRSWTENAESAGGRTQNLGRAFRNLNDDMLSTADTASALAAALDELLSPQMDLSEATDAWHSGLRNLNEDLAKNNKSLRGNTDAADKNREAIRDRVERMQALLVAEAEAGASSGQLSRMLRQQRQALIEAGVAAGMSRDELKDYLNTLGLTPKMVRTVLALNTESAMASLRQARRELDAMDGRTATARMEIITAYKTVGNATDAFPVRGESARGNIFPSVRHNAHGDIANRHQPELAGPGVTRVWREPETQGEAYIPLANDDRRPRARSIAEQTVELLGGAVMWNARGNLIASRGSGAPAPMPAPNVSVGGASVRVFIDGNEVRAIVSEEIAADDRHQRVKAGR